MKKIFLISIISIFIIFHTAFAHHEEFYPINWDAIMEYEIEKDAFKPKYYNKFPYGFIKTACERVENINYNYNDPLTEDHKILYKKTVKNYKPNDNLLAFFMQCNAISDMRHPPTKDVMKYTAMEKSYEEVYKLSVMIIHGCDYNFSSCVENSAKIAVGKVKANMISSNPDARNKWLINYYKKHDSALPNSNNQQVKVAVPDIESNCDVDAQDILSKFDLIGKRVDVHGPDDKDASSMGCPYRQFPKAGTIVKKRTVVTYRTWWEGS